MARVPSKATPHAREAPKPKRKAKTSPTWLKVAGGVGVGLALATPAIVGVLKKRRAKPTASATPETKPATRRTKRASPQARRSLSTTKPRTSRAKAPPEPQAEES